MKNKFLLIITLLLTNFFIAQNKKVDSIARTFSNKAWDFFEIQSDSALFYANKGIDYSQKYNSNLGKVLNIEIKGIYYEEVKNDYKTASELYFEAIEIAENNLPKLVSSLYNNLCIMYMATKDYEKAELYGKKAVENTSKIRGTRAEAKAYVNLGIAQSLLKKYDTAQATFTYFLSLKILSQFERNIANLRIAKNYKEQGKYAKAQPILLKIIALDSLKGQRSFNLDYDLLVNNSIQLNDKNAVLKFLPILKKSFKNEKSLEYKSSFLSTLVNAYKYLNNRDEAFNYQNKLLKVKDSLNNKKYNKQVAELETKYQTKKKEEQIIKEQNQKKIWSYFTLGAFLVLILVVLLLYKNSQKRKLLRANKTELEKLLNQRNMLLKETHHRVKNSFQMVSSLLQLQAEGSEAKAAVSALDNAVKRVNSMIVLHQQLYAKDNLLGIDLKIYMNDLIHEISNSYASENINFKTNISSTILDIDTATSIGLLVNELATNSIKYAWKEYTSEKIITLTIHEKDGKIEFKMFDNGTSEKTLQTKQNYGSELIEILIERLDADKIENAENDFGIELIFRKQND